MKPWIKILIGTVAGFAGGFAAGFFCHGKMNDIRFEEISEEEMKAIEDQVAAAKAGKEIDAKDEINRAFHPTEKIFDENALPEDPDKLRNTLQGKTPYIQADQAQKTAYEKLWQATKTYSNEENANELPTMDDDISPSEEEFDEEFLEMIEEETTNPGSGFVEPPHVITLAEFYNERPEFDKITIEWYQGDDTWLDEKEEFIADIDSYVGTINVRELFAKENPDGDPDIRFIRNDQYGTDYEIIRHHRSYNEETGGND